MSAPTDPVVAGCLDKIRRGEMTAVGVLADRLEETEHPLAARVREAWDDYLATFRGPKFRFCERWLKKILTDSARDDLRRRIAGIFRRRWYPPEEPSHILDLL